MNPQEPNNNQARPPRRQNSQNNASRNRSGNADRGPRPSGNQSQRQGSSTANRGAAVRAQKRSQMDAQKIANQYQAAQPSTDQGRANVLKDSSQKLKITFLGGQEAIGEKNMQVIEWENDAVVLDCGNNLGVELPGINYTIADPSYLESIKHKLRGYVISHGHLDHLGGLRHIVPRIPAPIYGSRFTIGIIQKSFEELAAEDYPDFTLNTVIMNMDNHERLKLGSFFVELVRITHSVPEASCIVVDTPAGRIINTGDWRLDPEPLDEKPSDIERLKQLGDEGVLVLLSDSCNTQLPGRTPTESTLQDSFHDIIGRAEGRVFVAVFSSNMNRVQMIINAAAAAGRVVALDGRSMMNYAEIAVRHGLLKIPKGTIVQMQQIPTMPDEKILVICTGGQGEPSAALQRMAAGEHRHIKLHEGDTVVVSSTPIPGNEVRYEDLGNDLVLRGVHLYRHPTHEIDGVGPLHVSGHARREEYREMLHLTRPKFFIPIYAGSRNRKYYEEIAVEEGWQRNHIIQANNGDSFLFDQDKYEAIGQVPYGSLLVDQTGSVTNNIVVKDRVMLAQEGLVAIVLTIDKRTGALLTSPDIISRGFIYMRDNEEIMNGLRIELKRAVQQRFKRVDLDRFKIELKDHITHFLFEHTNRSPIIIPVVNVVSGGRADSKGEIKPVEVNTVAGGRTKTAEDVARDQQQRFNEMRARLLTQDARTD